VTVCKLSCAAGHSKLRNMEAQKLITLSINKIAGSRRQRGGINLRKNLLVASVLHSARMHYYEEMCNRMPGHVTLENSKSESTMDNDCTESPDWENDEENVEPEDVGEEESYESENEPAGNSACDSEPHHTAHERLPTAEQCAETDKENVDPNGRCKTDNMERAKHENYVNNSADSDRVAFSNVANQTQNSSVETCTTTTCLTVPSIKRKRTETEEACEVISISSSTKRVKVDSQCQTVSSECGPQSSISTLVDIFKAGFHGLSGEAGSKLSTNFDEKDSESPSYTTLSTHSRPFETLQTAVIAAC